MSDDPTGTVSSRTAWSISSDSPSALSLLVTVGSTPPVVDGPLKSFLASPVPFCAAMIHVAMLHLHVVQPWVHKLVVPTIARWQDFIDKVLVRLLQSHALRHWCGHLCFEEAQDCSIMLQ